jgi:helicase
MIPGIKKSEIYELFESTLFAQHYRKATITFKVDAALSYLENEDLIKSKNERYIATEFGRHISLLYIDPQTGVEFKKAIDSIKKPTYKRKSNNCHTIMFLHLITNSPDFYPKISLRKKDFEEVSTIIQRYREKEDDESNTELAYPISEYNCSRSFCALYEWINETSDRVLSEKIGVEPGDMYRLVETANWLSYSLYEVAKLLKREDLLIEIFNLKIRIRYGIKEELLSLIALEGIGRTRARALYDASLTDISKVIEASESKLSAVPKIGPTLARRLKEQLNKKANFTKMWS